MTLAIDGGTPVRKDMLLFGAPVLGEDEIAEVVATLRSGWIGTGPKARRFEEEFAEWVGAPHAVAVNPCTAGLHLALLAVGVGPGDEVITPSLTFAATCNVVVHCGARPVFADIDPVTLCIDPNQLAGLRTARTKAVVPVHYGGLAADLEAIAAALPGVTIVEDAAHAAGSRYRGRPIGGHGHLTSFSFYANKNLTTGEGGMISVADDGLRERLQVLRLHGLNNDAWKRYLVPTLMHSEVVEAGFKYNLTDLAASIGLHQLHKQEAFLERREQLARRFDRAFLTMAGVRTQPRPEPTGPDRHALHLYVLVLEPEAFRVGRDQVVAALRAENIGAAIHYRPVHEEPYYRQTLASGQAPLPVTERVGSNVFSLPLTPGLSDSDGDDVIAAVDKVLSAYRR